MAWRPLHIPYKPNERSRVDADDSERKLQETRENALQNAVLESIFPPGDPSAGPRNIEYLTQLGLLEGEFDEEWTRLVIDDDCQAFFQRDRSLPDRWKRHLFFNAARWLVASNVLRLNICSDWQVNRKNPAKNVGLKSFEQLEAVIAKRYPAPEGKKLHHLHSGSGDNSGVYAANEDTRVLYEDGRKRNEVWDHLGFGNKLYAPIETFLGQFLKSEFRDGNMYPKGKKIAIFLHVLTEALQDRLAKKWPASPKGEALQPTGNLSDQRQDFNEIFRLLQNPRELLTGISFPQHAVPIKSAKYRVSRRFPGDFQDRVVSPTLAQVAADQLDRRLDDAGEAVQLVADPQGSESEKQALDAYKILMNFNGMSDAFIQFELLEYELHKLRIEQTSLVRPMQEVLKLQRRLKSGVSSQIEEQIRKRLRSMLREAHANLEGMPTESLAEALIVGLKYRQKVLQESIDRIEEKNELQELTGQPNEPTIEAKLVADISGRKFSSLVEAIRHFTSYDKLLLAEQVFRKLRDIQEHDKKLLEKLEKPPQLKSNSTEETKRKVKEIRKRNARKEPRIRMLSNEQVKNICETLLQEKFPPMITTRKVWEKIKKYIARLHEEHALDENREERTIQAGNILYEYFEHEFSDAVQTYGKQEYEDRKKFNRFHLIDVSKLNKDKTLLFHDIPSDVVVRANGEEVLAQKPVKIAGFTIAREGTTVKIEGSALDSTAKSAREPSFALEMTGALDLNKHPYAYLKNFVPGDFHDIGKKLPHETFGLITAIRSDSHINDNSFNQLLGDYMRLLAPGGCVITEGIEESYSQVIRLVASFPKEVGKIDIVMNAKKRPIALFIQKAHPNGYLTDEEKKEPFAEDVSFIPPEDLMRRPDEEIRNDVCKEIRGLFGNDSFVHIQEQLDSTRLQDLLRAASVGEHLKKNPQKIDADFLYGVARNVIDRDRNESDRERRLMGEDLQKALKEKLRAAILAKNKDTKEKTARNEPTIDGSTPFQKLVQIAEEDVAAKLLAQSLPEHFVRRSVWGIRNELLRALKTPLERGGNMEKLERCIVHAFVEREVMKEETSPAVVSERKREKMEELLRESRNLEYSKKPPFPAHVVNYVQRRTALRARRTIEKNNALREGRRVRDAEGYIWQFPRIREDEEVAEVPEFRRTMLSDNAQFATARAERRLQEKYDEVHGMAWQIIERTGRPPITFIDFRDCVTNKVLAQRLKEIFGDDFDTMVESIPCVFAEARGKTACIKNKSDFSKAISRRKNAGNQLWIAGGSWQDSFDDHGMLFKNLIRPHLETNIGENIQTLGICFASQVAGDILGERDHPKTRTRPGPLEIGLAAVTAVGDGIDHEIFRDCGRQSTVIMSRGGHLLGNQFHEQGTNMRVLARSDSTGSPVVWESRKKGILAIQFHPEFRCVQPGTTKTSPDCRMLYQQLGQSHYKRALKKRFSCNPADLQANFDTDAADIKGNAGPEILANALLYQLKLVAKNLGSPSPRRAR